ncbi:helix-turn-helix domain-containing protein [Streptomyces sp. BE20]|uniref:helix-turn-helix domain-containing protein n=1 Tax=unclassified Streptomyces TaxID=2593676 RepID=UPI002E790C40|nr:MULTISPECIES: helix-turn-helix domain-containing protein [unclassified Streptomyces]MED7948867.1 helix-turn-helix domain-containing protein [Streptomyces sp. BE303]MEE1822977.1 helix-turn-helix domain-containing protein [Streptomyces sp. BE20]
MTATDKLEKAAEFAVHITASTTPEDGFDIFRCGGEEQTATAPPAPVFVPGHNGEYEISTCAVTVLSAVIADVLSTSLLGTLRGVPFCEESRVMVHVVRRTALSDRRSVGQTKVSARRLPVHRSGAPTHEAARDPAASVLILPASSVDPLRGDRLRGDRLITGSADALERWMLLAHVRTIDETLTDPAGSHAGRNTLTDPGGGVVAGQPDDSEPRLASVLVRAVKNVIDRRLTDPDLSPATLARTLNISVRTLHRAFATAAADHSAVKVGTVAGRAETVAGYIRGRRLEQARFALSARAGRPSVAEVAARWQFADSSHFIRTFKSRYGQTPAAYARDCDHAEPPGE